MTGNSTGFWAHLLTVVPIVVGWTVMSYLCHECGKRFLRETTGDIGMDDAGHEAVTRLAWALILTVVQCMTCILLVRTQGSDKEVGQSRTLLVLMTTHFFATLCTNYSMAYIEAASTFAIKLTEPVTMTIGHHLIFMLPVPFETVVSIPLIVFGVLLFSGHNAQTLTGSFGIFLAFASNVILTARNIAMKKLQPEGQVQSDKAMSLRSVWCIALTLSMEVIVVTAMRELAKEGSLPASLWWLATLILGSGLFHVAYSYISTNVVLKMMNVVSHSIANIFKRILVVLLLYASGKRHASGVNFMGLLVAAIGVFIYIRGKTRRETPPLDATEGKHHGPETSRRNIFLALVVLTLSSMVVLAAPRDYLELQDIKHRFSGLVEDNSNQVILAIDNNSSREINPVMDFNSYNTLKFDPDSVIDPAMKEFVNWRYVDHPEETDIRAKTLTTNREVVGEAQRILINLMQDLLGGARNVMLIEIATYENKGDPAIATGEVMLLRKMNINIVYYCPSAMTGKQKTLDHAYEVSKNYAKDDLVILLQGGGNLVGYEWCDLMRKKFIEKFTDRKIILFSQSIWLHEKVGGHLKTCQKIYSNRTNLVMFLRDRQSLEIAKKNFHGTKLILAPDLAFCIGMVPRQLPPLYDIVWLKRGDTESSGYMLPEFPADISVDVLDWYSWKSNSAETALEQVFLIATAGFQFLQRGRVVVTDRLHGHILSTLMNIPHVLIDNPPHHKLSSFDKSWTANLSNTVLVTDGESALKEAMILLKRYNSILPQIGPKDMYVAHD